MYELTWQELGAWMKATSTSLTPWEAQAIKAIASAYTGAVAQYSGKAASAPWQPKEMAENAIRSALRNRGAPRD